MRLLQGLTVAAAVAVLVPVLSAQQDASKGVAGGGISVKGWTGKVDASKENGTLTINDAKFMAMGTGFHVTTGPAVTYWNAANRATGDYTVRATFNEPKMQGLNSHAHPYGIMIGGNDLDTPNASMLYCSAYGTGNYLVRGFSGATVFTVQARAPHAAVTKVAAGEPVKQDIAVSVKGDKVECSINGQTVGSWDKAAIVGAGKLKSTDGVYGLRFGHNTEAMVSNFGIAK